MKITKKEVALVAVTKAKYSWVLDEVSAELQNDKEVVLAAVKNCGYALRWASKELQNDKEVVLAAIRNEPHALVYASYVLQHDQELLEFISKQ